MVVHSFFYKQQEVSNQTLDRAKKLRIFLNGQFLREFEKRPLQQGLQVLLSYIKP